MQCYSRIDKYVIIATLNKKKYNYTEKSWSRGLVKSRQKNGRDSRSRETEVGEKIAVTTVHLFCTLVVCSV